MSNFFKKQKAGLEDVIAYEQGKLHLRSETIEIPEPPARYKAQEIKKMRKDSKRR
jgi:putative transcriptional regulator